MNNIPVYLQKRIMAFAPNNKELSDLVRDGGPIADIIEQLSKEHVKKFDIILKIDPKSRYDEVNEYREILGGLIDVDGLPKEE